MSSVVISGDTSGTITVSAPAVAGSNTATLPAATGELSMLGGSGQTWQDLTASRAAGTTYTNSTGKPIQLAVKNTNAVNVTVSGLPLGFGSSAAGSTICLIVPNGATYSYTGTVTAWYELR